MSNEKKKSHNSEEKKNIYEQIYTFINIENALDECRNSSSHKRFKRWLFEILLSFFDASIILPSCYAQPFTISHHSHTLSISLAHSFSFLISFEVALSMVCGCALDMCKKNRCKNCAHTSVRDVICIRRKTVSNKPFHHWCRCTTRCNLILMRREKKEKWLYIRMLIAIHND